MKASLPIFIAVSFVLSFLVGAAVGYAVGHRRGNATCNETSIVISSRDVAYLFHEPTLGTIRVSRDVENNRLVGFKIYGVRRASFAGRVGLQNGDSIRAINARMPTEDVTWDMYGELLDHPGEPMVYRIVRHGVTLTRTVSAVE